MNLVALAEQSHQRLGCWDSPDLFSNPALDYDPAGEDFKSLTQAQHDEMAQAKDEAEQAAVNKCYDCPLMMACEQADIENINNRASKSFHIIGVVAGLTQAEREMRHGLREKVEAADGSTHEVLVEDEVQVAEHRLPGDRGPRNQVDDAEVARLTRAGYTSAQIAEHLDCCTRTVTRARDRMGLRSETRAEPKVAAAVAEAAPRHAESSFVAHAVAALADAVARTEVAAKKVSTSTQTPAVAVTGISFLGGRPLPAATEAVYNYLASMGGSASWESILDVAVQYVTDEEGHDWWFRQNSVVVGGQRVLKSSREGVSLDDRILTGKRNKVYNAIDATVRKGRYLTRSTDKSVYTFDSASMNEWVAKMQANAATVTEVEHAALVAA